MRICVTRTVRPPSGLKAFRPPSVALALTLLAFCGCRSQAPASSPLHISMIPTTDPSKALRENQPLLAYWQKATGRTPQLTIPTS